MSVESLLTDQEYKVDLDVFEGPLDLLLYLIRREEVDIYDIPIERITGQYVAYLGMMRMLNLDVAGEFVVMAATLMMIKSRMLLPADSRGEEDPGEEEWVDPRLDLVRQLVEYKKFKDAAGRLARMEGLRAESFACGGAGTGAGREAAAADPGKALGDVDLFDLLTAFREALARAPDLPEGYMKLVSWSVPEKMEMIVGRIAAEGRLSFSSLFRPESPRAEVIAVFLAALELIRLHRIRLLQSAPFQEIQILPPDVHSGMRAGPVRFEGEGYAG